MKPCLLCTNVYAADGRDIVARDATGTSVPHTCADSSRLRLHTRATVAAVLRALSEQADQPKSKGKLEELETRLGWRHDPGALLADGWLLPHVHPTLTCIFDWMHVVFVNGVFGAAVGQLMGFAMNKDNSFKKRGFSYAAMNAAIEGFTWPKLVGKGPRDVFSPKRAASHWEAAAFKASASEGLSVSPFMLYFVQQAAAAIHDAELTRHVLCFAMLCGIVQSLHGAHRGGVNTDALQGDINAFLAEFKHLYGEWAMAPKCHYRFCVATSHALASSLQRAMMPMKVAMTTTMTMMATTTIHSLLAPMMTMKTAMATMAMTTTMTTKSA